MHPFYRWGNRSRESFLELMSRASYHARCFVCLLFNFYQGFGNVETEAQGCQLIWSRSLRVKCHC